MRKRQIVNDSVPRLLLSVNEAAQALGLGRSFIYGLLRSRQIIGVRIGRQWRIAISELQRYIQDQMQ